MQIMNILIMQFLFPLASPLLAPQLSILLYV